MKAIFVSALTAILSGCVGTVHTDPTEISSLEISVYQSGMQAGCKSGARKKGDAAGEAACDCIVERMRSSVARENWQRATFFAQQRRDRDEAEIMLPYAQSAARACGTSKG